MSRCFPFPPPGYEKKIRTDEADHLTKEKRKEKKHKKDKKDKEKKEGKEKKDKERSKEKHKERKEKKEKHKDRKDKDRDKEKSRTPEEKKPEALPDIRDTEKVRTSILQNNSNGDSRFVQDLARRISDGEEATGSRSEQRTKVVGQRNTAPTTGRAVENNSCQPFQETNHRRDDDKRINTLRNFAVPRFPRESFVTDQKRVEGMGKPVEKKDAGKQMEVKEKTRKHMESLINSDKPRDQEGVQKSDSKDRERYKEKKEERTGVINKTGLEKLKVIEGVPRLKERDRDSLDIRNSKPPYLSKASNKNITGEGNLGKRKDLETNGFLYENGSRPNKLQRPVSSPTAAVENGRKFGANQTPPKPTSEPQGMVCKPSIKEHRINGFIDSQEPKVLPPSSLATTAKAQVKENGEASAKPPHPDLKYLTQILSIPERELPEFDEQEWLLGGLGVKSKKSRTDDSPASDETRQVWDQAFRIEPADIAALPYVVPY